MKLTKALAVPAITLAILGAGLTVGAATPAPSAPAPSPGIAMPSPTAAPKGVGTPAPPHCEEDEPCWDCLTMGNRICGDPDETRATAAWDTFDRFGGAAKLRVDPSRPFRVEYVGYAAVSPKLTGEDLAMPGTDGLWYVFRADY